MICAVFGRIANRRTFESTLTTDQLKVALTQLPTIVVVEVLGFEPRSVSVPHAAFISRRDQHYPLVPEETAGHVCNAQSKPVI